MTNHTFSLCAIGNALVDIIAHLDDDFLKQENIAKGSMTLIDGARAEKLYAQTKDKTEICGGSASNTAVGFASLGGKAAFIGCVQNDRLGDIFIRDMQSQAIHFVKPNLQSTALSTGRCFSFVTPDKERSMATYLGISNHLHSHHIDEAVIRASHITYLEGYLFDLPEAKQAFYTAAKIAHEAGQKIALSLSDKFCVDRHAPDFMDFIHHHTDILFANEEEVCALYQTTDLTTSLPQLQKDCPLSITTRNAKGAIITTAGETITIQAQPVKNLVDTTGAGDLFASGFLYGITHGMDLAESGRLGTKTAAEIIGHNGARPLRVLKELLA